MEIPPEISGVEARIIALVGKWFPTGSHKVGATFGCLVPRLVTGQFDPTRHKAVWPSTGNFCRGGAYDAALLGCESIAILPEEMSRERFEWLSKIAGEVIATPGSESNVKEIFDKCRELSRPREDVFIFNQFEEAGNHLWHYEVTGHAAEEALRQAMAPNDRYAGFVSQTGSAGTLGAGDYLKERFPLGKIAAGEALQCPTLLRCGYGAHRIEGIGDKHVPWIHNASNTDMVIADGRQRLPSPAATLQRAGRAELPGEAGGLRRGHRSASPAGNLQHRQPAVRHQVRQILRADPARRGGHGVDGLHGSVPQPPGGDDRSPTAPYYRDGGRPGLSPLPHGRIAPAT